MMENWREAGFGLYVHWPFCEAKCPYCDFNSHVSDAVDHDRWRSALVADLRHQAEQVPDRVLSSIFFGGGTPSRMHPDTVAAVIEEARRLWPTVNDLEISLEANPTSVEAARFSAFAAAGVTRVSIGLQAMRDNALRKLGRTHSVAQALGALEIARAQFERVSFDLIYARQDQTMADWTTELNEALALQPDHISLYQLTIEPGTVFARRALAGKLPGLPNDDQIADMYLETNNILVENGLPAYEVSNHARSAATCRHNLIYWRSGDWLGVGPGAHGRYGSNSSRKGTVSFRTPNTWLNAVETCGHGIESTELGTETGHADEYLLSSLRLAEGLNLERLSQLGIEIPRNAIEDIAGEGLVATNGERVIPTDRGRALADSIVAYFAARSVPARESASQS